MRLITRDYGIKCQDYILKHCNIQHLNVCRRGYVALEKETALAKLRGCNKLTLVLTSLRDNSQLQLGPLGTEYGAKTYIPFVAQSDCGISKFFSILKFIVSSLMNLLHRIDNG